MSKKPPPGKKRTAILHLDHKHAIAELDMEQRGELLTHIFEYAENFCFDNLCFSCQPVRIVFQSMRGTFDADAENWQRRCEVNQANRNKGKADG